MPIAYLKLETQLQNSLEKTRCTIKEHKGAVINLVSVLILKFRLHGIIAVHNGSFTHYYACVSIALFRFSGTHKYVNL